MSNTARIEALYAAFATGDIQAVLGGLDEKVEWTEAVGYPYAGTYVGPQEILEKVFMRLGTEWDGYSAVPDTIIGQDDTVVAVGWYGGTYKATGKSMRARFAHVWELRDGKAVRFEQVVDSVPVQEALR